MTGRSNLRRRVAEATRDERVLAAVHLATWRKVDAREQSFAALHHAAALRDKAARIRRHTLENLPHYLEQFVRQATALGAAVHFAPDGPAACRIVAQLAVERGLRLAVKGKSMTSEEIGLNAALEAVGVRVVETDLGEFIVQIDHDRPSHIITPIIHKDRRTVADAMARELGCPRTEDPAELTRIARRYLRDIFRRCDLGITGVNLAVAETGTLCLCTNEGNGRMTITRPRVHVALMGIEKIIPRLSDLPVFLKVLARSSTGQPMGVYTTLINGPRRSSDPDGPQELHIVILDNGRSAILKSPLREVLACIRCGACLNACPAYRNVGGHAYASVYPGPIGSVVTPLLKGPECDDLARLSSLCGACRLACPVQIDIPALLIALRARAANRQPASKRLLLAVWRRIMQYARLYRFGQRLLRWSLPDQGDGWVRSGTGPMRDWTLTRDLPRPPRESFREIWEARLRDER